MAYAQNIRRLSLRVLYAGITILGATALSPHALGGISDEVFVFEASSAAGSGSVTVRFADGAWDPVYQKFFWALAEPVAIIDAGSGQTVCTLQAAEVTYRHHCRHSVSFTVLAGASETTVHLKSALLTFPELPAEVAEGQASASIALSDIDANGASVASPGGGDSGMFRAHYNGHVPDGAVFAALLGSIVTDNGGTGAATQNDPASGFRLVGSAVHDSSVEFQFVLSANDEAAGQGAFRLQPEPSCVEDRDGDGTPDCVDECPDDPAKIIPGACGCGVPDVDSDHDGVPDCLEQPDGGSGGDGGGEVGGGTGGAGGGEPGDGGGASGGTGSDPGDGGGAGPGGDDSPDSPDQNDGSDGALGNDGANDSGGSSGVVAGTEVQNNNGNGGDQLGQALGNLSFCGAGAGLATTLSLISLVGARCATRRRR